MYVEGGLDLHIILCVFVFYTIKCVVFNIKMHQNLFGTLPGLTKQLTVLPTPLTRLRDIKKGEVTERNGMKGKLRKLEW